MEFQVSIKRPRAELLLEFAGDRSRALSRERQSRRSRRVSDDPFSLDPPFPARLMRKVIPRWRTADRDIENCASQFPRIRDEGE